MDELNDYIQTARDKGFSDKEILKQLTDNGWNENSVLGALGLKIPSGSENNKSHKSVGYSPSKGVKILYKLIRYISLYLFLNTAIQIIVGILINSSGDGLTGTASLLYLLLIPILLTNPLTLLIANFASDISIGLTLVVVYAVLALLTYRSIMNERKGLSLNPFTFVSNKSVKEVLMYLLVALQVLPIFPLALFLPFL